MAGPHTIAWGPIRLQQLPSGDVVAGFEFELVRGGSGWHSQELEKGMVGTLVEEGPLPEDLRHHSGIVGYRVVEGAKATIYPFAPWSTQESVREWFDPIENGYRAHLDRMGLAIP